MVQIKGTNCNDVFEAILAIPEETGNSLEKLEKAYNTLSDLFDMAHDVHKEILSELKGNARVITELQFEQVESHLMKAQHFLNTLIEAKNEKTSK